MSHECSRTLLLSALLVFAAPATLLAHDALRFDGGRWLVDGRFEERTMYSVDGKLRETWDGEVEGEVDLGGGWVVPPLADAHTHALASPQFAAESSRASIGATRRP